MPIQPTFDGLLALRKPITDQDVHAVLEHCAPWYVEEARRVGTVDGRTEMFHRLAFAMLSTNSPFAATCAAWQAYCQVEPWDIPTVRTALRTPGRDGVIAFQETKAWNLLLLWHRMFETTELQFPSEDIALRDYLRKQVTGLAWTKASFATMLVKGAADVACIDTHMYRLFAGQPWQRSLPKWKYLLLEGSLRTFGRAHELATSVVQHCLWDAMRGQRAPLLPI